MNRKTVLTYTVTGIVSFMAGWMANWSWKHFVNVDVIGVVESETDEGDVVQVANLEMENGFIYSGELKDNRRYGYGRMVTPKGTVYEGEWINNRMISGTMITEKSEYEGQFQVLSPNGYGSMRYKDGSYYRGNWSKGVKTGIGLFVDSLGRQSFGLWTRGVIERSTMTDGTGKLVYGIDLSHHNEIKGWGELALYVSPEGLVYRDKPGENYVFQPVSFVYVKATEGATHRDRDYLTNMADAKKHHKIRGSYHFMHLTSSSSKEQAENFLDYVGTEIGELPPALDIEVRNQAEKIGATATRQKVLEWLELVEDRLGVRPIIYTSARMKRDFFETHEFERYDFWVAHYKDEMPDAGSFALWQCTDKGCLYGHSSVPVDVNVFNGGMKEFSSFMQNNQCVDKLNQ